jgi:RecJ-like exonuclease
MQIAQFIPQGAIRIFSIIFNSPLTNINMPKTVILAHGDCDGICAAAIALAKFPGSYVFFTRPSSLLDDLYRTSADRLVITDIALTKRDAPQIIKETKKRKDVLYFDHHEIPKTVKPADIKAAVNLYVHGKGVSTSELIYKTYKNDMPEERVWLAIYGAIGDYEDDTPFVKEKILNWDKRALYFQVSTITLGIKNDEFAEYSGKRMIVKTLAAGDNPSDIPGFVKSARKAVSREFQLYELIKEKAQISGKVAYTVDTPTFGFRGPSALFAATAKNAPIGLSVHNRNRYTDITMRTRDTSLKLNRLAERAADHVDGSGGGHEGAAGAKIPIGTIDKFIEKLNSMIGV